MAASVSTLRIHGGVGLSSMTVIHVDGKRVEVAYDQGPKDNNTKWVFPLDIDAPLYRACHNDSYYRTRGFQLYDKCWVYPSPSAKQNSLIESLTRQEGLDEELRGSLIALQKSFRLAYNSLEPGGTGEADEKQQPLHYFKVVHPGSYVIDAEERRQLHFKVAHPGSDSVEPGVDDAVEPDSVENLSVSELQKALADVEERHRPVVLKRALSKA